MRRARREAAWRLKGPTKEQREAYQAGTLPSGENDSAPESLGSGLVDTENARSFSAQDGAGEASGLEASATAGDSAASMQSSDIPAASEDMSAGIVHTADDASEATVETPDGGSAVGP